MKKNRILKAGLLAALLASPMFGTAEDIDIYDGLNNVARTPNVLILLDNGANFSANSGQTCTYSDGTAPSLNGTTGGIEQCAIYNTIDSLDVNADGTAKVNIGLMVFNHGRFTPYGCHSSGEAGCLLVPLTAMTSEKKAELKAWIKTWQTSGNTAANVKASGDATAQTVQEAWAYFAGKTGLSGRDYSAIKPANSGCQENYTIYIGNAWDTNGTPGDIGSVKLASTLATAPGIIESQKVSIAIPAGRYGTAAFSCSKSYTMGNHTEGSGLYADEWARYMYQTDINGVYGGNQNITTYTIGLLGDKCVPEYPALLNSMATYGGGKYFATSNYNEIAAALTKIINEVLAVNSVFSSSSLPVSVNTQGTYLNQVYMGMFRPDKGGYPRWHGNLKQYQFKLDPVTNVLRLADSLGESAISSAGTGFISPNAISFWTVKDTTKVPDNTGGFWKIVPQGTGMGYDYPDGEVVEKGGAAQQLRLANLTNDYTASAGSTSNSRRLYTYCPSGTSCVAELSDSTNVFAPSNASITAAQLGVATADDRTRLINWVRGQDNAGDERGPGGTVTVRPSIHGDVLHSRPVVVSYGGSPEKVVVYYGSNDGVFHAVNGNQNGSIGSVPPGGELWGLVLPEFYGSLKRQRDNTPIVKFPTTDSDLNPQPKSYFVDGPTGMYQKLNADGTTNKAYIYLTMRRGGRFLYALDVTSPTAPRVVWKKSASDTGMGELGQTWSRPRLAVVKGYPKPVLIFGGGYSSTQDNEPPTADTMGRGIFMLDAETGALIWSAGPSADSTACSGTTTQAACRVAGMNYSIPADIALLDRDRDGYVERLYAVDLGGNIWRVDLEPATTGAQTPDTWQVKQIAALGCNAGACASGTTPRKFFFQPSVIPFGKAGAVDSFDVLLLGSGDREHPRYSAGPNSSHAVVNRLYMLKDTKTGKNGSGQDVIVESALFNATSVAYNGTLRGYYITLGTGEKSVNAPLTVGGITSFGTNQAVAPDLNSCSTSLGIAYIYSLNLFTGTRTSTRLDGGGLPPSPVSGVVSIGDKKIGFCIGCVSMQPGTDTPPNDKVACNSALDNCYKDADGPKKAKRAYWSRR